MPASFPCACTNTSGGDLEIYVHSEVTDAAVFPPQFGEITIHVSAPLIAALSSYRPDVIFKKVLQSIV